MGPMALLDSTYRVTLKSNRVTTEVLNAENTNYVVLSDVTYNIARNHKILYFICNLTSHNERTFRTDSRVLSCKTVGLLKS